MFKVTFGTFEIILIGLICVLLYRSLMKSIVDRAVLRKIERLVLYAFLIRAIWYLIYFAFIAESYPFMITDDYNYYYTALSQHLTLGEGRNAYQVSLIYLYHYFGASSLNGRIVNLFASVLAVYPVAFIENTICSGKSLKLLGTKLYCFAPYMVVISAFEIKDILALLFFASSCMMLIHMSKKRGLTKLWVFALFCILSECMRSGMGILVAAVYAFTISIKIFYEQKSNRALFRMVGTIIVILCFAVVFFALRKTIYYNDIVDMLSEYMRGRDKSIQTGGIFNFLTIRDWTQLWKVPLDFLVFCNLPLASENTGRLLLDYGVYFRMIDAPLCTIGIYWLIRNAMGFKQIFACIIVPYAYLSCFQVLSYRELIFLIPLLYILGANYLCTASIVKSKVVSRVNDKIRINHVGIAYTIIQFLWILLVVVRIAS